MRVGILAASPSRSRGGVFVFQHQILLALLGQPRRHDYVVLQTGAPEDLPMVGGVACVQVDVPKASWVRRGALAAACRTPTLRHLSERDRRQREAAALDRQIRAHRIDAVLFPTSIFVPVDVPYVYTVLDLQHRRQPWFPEVSANGAWKAREAQYSLALSRAFAVIAGNTTARDEIVRYYRLDPERVVVLPPFCPTLPSEELARRPSIPGLPEHAPFVFYPAQYWPHKNHVALFGALRLLGERSGREVHLVCTGSDQGNLAYLKDQARALGIERRVHFAGFVDNAELVALYRQALALVYPSLFGPYNLPPLEAFTLGCPVVAAAVAGAEEQLGDAAVLVPPTDDDGYASAILALLQDPSRRDALIARGRERAARYDVGSYTAGVEAVLDRLALHRRCWAPTT